MRFNFREQKWVDVLDWFARQASLSLVMDKSPPGAFTYTNNRSYSPSEAIDLLNSVLLTKGFSLMQRGRMLILVDLTDDLPANLIPRVGGGDWPNTVILRSSACCFRWLADRPTGSSKRSSR